MAEEVKDLAPEVDHQASPETEEKRPEPLPEIEDLRQQLEASKREAREAQAAAAESDRRAQTQQAEATRFRSEAERAQFVTLERAIEAGTAKLDQLRAGLADAFANGDHNRAAELQVEISTIAARKDRLEDGKAAMEARLNAPQPQQHPQQGDPVERVASTLTPRSAAWVRAHPEAVTNPATFRKLSAVSQYALNVKGIPADSDEFFAHVEQEMGYRQPPAATSAAATPRQTPNYRTRPGAGLPPARSSSPANGKRIATAADIPDTDSIKEAAATAGISTDEYKKQYIRLVGDGTINDVHGVMH